MPERIAPPKLKGHEHENVFDLSAYRAALQAQTLPESSHTELLEIFDAAAEDMRDLDHAEDGLEFALQVHGIASRLDTIARTRGAGIPADTMSAFSDALTHARAAAAAARHIEETRGSLQDAVARMERARKELLRAIEVLFVAIVRSSPRE